MVVSAVCVPAFTKHLLVKVCDHKGRDIGQGVLCLKDVLLLAARTHSQTHPHTEGEGEEGEGEEEEEGLITLPLSLGGRPQPVLLSMRCVMREEPFAMPRGGGGVGSLILRGTPQKGGG
jgi:hypothetical protein